MMGSATLAGGEGARPSRSLDGWLFATLLPLFFAMLIGGIQAHRAAGERVLPFRLTGAQGTSGYPIVIWQRTPQAEVRQGDRILRLGEIDLQGLSYHQIGYQAVPLLRAGEPFVVEGERDGVPFEAVAEPSPFPSWWWSFPTWVAFVLVGSFLLKRAPHWHLARVFFLAAVGWACFGVSFGPMHPLLKFLGIGVAGPIGFALALWFFLSWGAAGRPGPLAKALAGTVLVLYLVVHALNFSLVTPTGTLPNLLIGVLAVFNISLSLAALVRAYRRSKPLEQRKLRWILYTVIVGSLPMALTFAATAVLPQIDNRAFTLSWGFFGLIPLGFAVAIVGYGWLDIDRVISASAAATVVGVTLVGGLLAIVPPVARRVSMTLGIEPEAGRLVLSTGLAIVLVPAYRWLRPRFDRWMFAEQHAVAQRFDELRADLGAARGVEEMATRAGEGFDALLLPESVAIYSRAGEVFTPLFLRGRELPAEFEAKSVLVQVLEAKRAPLLARSKGLGPFERAALETLGAAAVVPLLRELRLVAFLSLGPKRSGDIYTKRDLALLASVSERCAEVIARIDTETLAREAQAMQAALRRYVPGAVADRVLAGDSMAPAEREVTVLFVDIRGYTGMAEQLAAEDVFATLNEHTERVSRIVQADGGTIVEFNGDGMMAVFGAFEALPKKEQSAVEAARRIVDSMPSHLAVGVGVATGQAFVGSIRSADRLIWSAVGSTTNLAARLQSLTRDLDASVALDETTRERAGYVCADFHCHEKLPIRGRTGRFDVFALPQH